MIEFSDNFCKAYSELWLPFEKILGDKLFQQALSTRRWLLFCCFFFHRTLGFRRSLCLRRLINDNVVLLVIAHVLEVDLLVRAGICFFNHVWLFVLIADILLGMFPLYLFSSSPVRSLLIRFPFILSSCLLIYLCRLCRGCLSTNCLCTLSSLVFRSTNVLLGNLKLGV